MKKLIILACSMVFLFWVSCFTAMAEGYDIYNGCGRGEANPCLRTGSCFIEGSSWYANVIVDRSDDLDTRSFSELCTTMHRSLAEGKCEPLYRSRPGVISYMGEMSWARIPATYLTDSLTCGGEKGASLKK